MRPLAASLLLALGLACAPSAAITGNDFVRWHEEAKGQRVPLLIAYLRGMLDAEMMYADLFSRLPADQANPVWAIAGICAPPGATVDQAYDIVLQLALERPANRDAELRHFARIALSRAWRCGK
jgi:hypothetical protein